MKYDDFAVWWIKRSWMVTSKVFTPFKRYILEWVCFRITKCLHLLYWLKSEYIHKPTFCGALNNPWNVNDSINTKPMEFLFLPPKTYCTTALRIPLILQMRKLFTKNNVSSKAIVRYIHIFLIKQKMHQRMYDII